MERHYFDWAATAIPEHSAETRQNKASTMYVPLGNPSSVHTEGKTVRNALEDARLRCAKALGVKPEELYFTGGGTESNAIVLFSLLSRLHNITNDKVKNPRSAFLLYSAAEHPSIRENAKSLEQLGLPSVSVGIETDGRISEVKLEKALAKNPDARMAAIMAVNNETGAINDIKVLTELIRKQQKNTFHVHCDAVQAMGKIPLALYDWGIDSASFSAHKIGGTTGIGLLWLKSPIIPLIRGGDQENKIRPGTENTRGAMDMTRVMEKYAAPFTKTGSLPSFYNEAVIRMKVLINALRQNGSFIPIPEDRSEEDSRFSPWILQGAFKNKRGKIIPGEVMVRALDEKGFAVSTGSACSSRDLKRPVLEAMGLGKELSQGGIRISQGYSTTTEEIKFLAKTITALLITL